MKITEKKRLLALLGTVKEAQAAGLYDECLYGAEALYGYIAEKCGEEIDAAKHLRQYCDMLSKGGEMGVEELESQLERVRCSVEQGITARMEIAFISYNAAMADCFESIYTAAEADEICDAYVVKVPYYERNPDRTLGKMVYSDEHNINARTVSYADFDLSRHPDVIFTNNPYDSTNLVTCVHPDYFTQRLKENTELLCYVPYYIPHAADGGHPADFVASRPFDLITAVSQKDSDIYAGLRKNAEVFGSTKIDKLIREMGKERDIPARWRQQIPDIDNRKIVTLVTSLGMFNELYVEWLYRFVEGLDGNIALIYRPHPLTSATIQSLQPELQEKYNRILERIKTGGFGLVDNDPDGYDVILKADAFIGESYSSLARLFAYTGKPVLEPDMVPGSQTSRRGGVLQYSYLESTDFSAADFINGVISGEVPARDEEQVAHNRSLYAVGAVSAGQRIYDYVKKKIWN